MKGKSFFGAWRQAFIRQDLTKSVPLYVLIALVISLALLKKETFSLYFMEIKLDNALPLFLLAIGQTFVLISGGMDLSVGGVMSLATCIMAVWDASPLVMIPALLVMGLAVGFVNGLLIDRFSLQPFIITLGTWTMLGGCAFLLLKLDGGTIHPAFQSFFTAKILGLPISLYIILLMLLLWKVFKNTRFGYAVFSLGSSERSAYYNGMNISSNKVATYMVSGLFAVIGGMAYSGQVGTGSPIVGNGNIMLSVAAAVIGGTSLSGGRGGVPGTLVGVLILKLMSDVLLFSGVTSYWTPLFQGCLLILCVAVGSLLSSIKEKRSLVNE